MLKNNYYFIHTYIYNILSAKWNRLKNKLIKFFIFYKWSLMSLYTTSLYQLEIKENTIN